MQTQTMKGNLSQTPEVMNLIQKVSQINPKLGEDLDKIPTYNKGYYCFFGYSKSMDEATDTVKQFEVKKFSMDARVWETTRPQLKSAPAFGFQKMAMVHNPRLQTKVEVPTNSDIRELTDEQKQEVNDLQAQGLTVSEIAKQMPKSVRQKDVAAYLENA